jgi:hypothetical protein
MGNHHPKKEREESRKSIVSNNQVKSTQPPKFVAIR